MGNQPFPPKIRQGCCELIGSGKNDGGDIPFPLCTVIQTFEIPPTCIYWYTEWSQSGVVISCSVKMCQTYCGGWWSQRANTYLSGGWNQTFGSRAGNTHGYRGFMALGVPRFQRGLIQCVNEPDSRAKQSSQNWIGRLSRGSPFCFLWPGDETRDQTSQCTGAPLGRPRGSHLKIFGSSAIWPS